MLNYVWLAFLVVAVLVGGFTGKLPDLTSGAFEGAEKAVMKVVLPLLGIWAIWLGIMRLAERAGLVQALASALRPVMGRLFPDVPRDHPAVGAMVMNMAANMLGLGNAATPLGLRAMRLLESLNPSPGVATNAMCTFLALNTASIQILPLTAIGILVTAGARSATSIVITAFLATLCAAVAGVVAAKFLENLPRFRVEAPSKHAAPEPQPPGVTDAGYSSTPSNGSAVEPGAPARPEVEAQEAVELEKIALPALTRKGRIGIALYVAAFAAMFLLLLFPGFFSGVLRQLHPGWSAPSPPPDFAGKSLGVRSLMAVSLLAIPFLLSFFPLYAAFRGVKVYEEFVEGAKEAWGTAQRTIPYLVAMLVAIGMLQKAGVIDLLTHWISPLLSAVGFPADLLPMVLMRPLSGSATNGLFVELVQRLHDPDGFVSRLAGTIYGSTETTFYVLTVYFGSVSIRRTRHAVITGLTADTVAVVASVLFCRLLFR
jgi:spore maturation protein SpmA